ncbi:MAG TPA: tRNA (N(6)-L-threonylcarbamoyladenosine(37)-C(2))-methylthiotransferase MtaB [Oscillospiraceae bacterium]|nr:tRNA (N(6)-L-threonylcarbamoyladenosine(37)-C(2))-methylthiotransferase MtaB [Oscillospiraceae bacterium]
MNVLIATLGCKVNQSESQAVGELFSHGGHFVLTPSSKMTPDICLVNTCAVTVESEHKSRQALSKMRRTYPNAVVVLCGCMPQVAENPASYDADIIVGSKGRKDIPALVERFLKDKKRIIQINPHLANDTFEQLSPVCFEHKTRAFLKIEDGCDRFCSYCIIPYARGRVRSMPLAEIGGHIKNLTAAGHREIVLTGINLAAYGQDLCCSLADAVKEAAKAGAERIRLGSVEADLMQDRFLHALAEIPQFCPQFHLSLQSGSDTVLSRMNRHYTTEEYYRLTRKLKTLFQNPSFTTDIMVGFPGETDNEFAESVDFVQKVGFSRLHVFAYSARPGTPAAKMTQVPPDVKKQRAASMAEIGDKLVADFAVSQIGQTVSVLFETVKNGQYLGRAENYVPIIVESPIDLRKQILSVLVISSEGETCFGTVIS